MRRFALLCVSLLFAEQAHAQSYLTDNFQLLRPELTISVFRDFTNTPTGQPCNSANGYNLPLTFGSAFECESWINTPVPAWRSIGGGFDATGALYQITPNDLLSTTDIVRGIDNTTETIARLPSSVGVVINLALDNANGRLYLAVRTEGPAGIVVISGLPTMFDTLLTFIPGGQAISTVTPRHPDGFRSAESVQIWTGDVRSMPDWSQAQPLTCAAATNPAPGQIVTVPDTLPDPAPGGGRYYIAATQHAADRRLGRQYVGGSFNARDPASLPLCAP